MSTKASAAALVAAVFFAGVAGTLGVLRVVEHQGGPPPIQVRGRPGGGPGGPGSDSRPRGPSFREGFPGSELARMELSDRLADRLDLTDEQRELVEAAMERRRQFSEQAMAEVLPRLRSQMDSLRSEIEEILSPAQAEAFRSFQEDGGGRFQRGRRGRRPPN